jgi:phenylacetate-CoA ligase
LGRKGDRFDEIEGWPVDRLRRWQVERLRAVVRAAAEAGGFWARRWRDAGVGPDDLRTIDDLGRFPIVGKRDLLEDAVSEPEPKGPVAFSTRGTSGEPLLVWLDRAESESYVVPTMRGYWWAGLRPGMTALLMSPAWHRLAAMEAHAVVRLGGRAAFFWGSVDSRSIDSFLDTVAGVKPDFVTTTAPFALSVLRRCDDEGLDPRLRFGSVRSLLVVGLPLTPHLRVYLRDRLGVGDVFERSGTQEGAALDECGEHVAPHVHADVCLLEIVDAEGRPVPRGSRGRLLLTKLVEGGSPFVRYDTGDIAVKLPLPCPCGRTLDRVKIVGRPESSVIAAGKLVTAYDVRVCVEEDPALVGRLLLLIRDPQRSPDTLGVAVEGEPSVAGRLEERLRARFGVDVFIEWLGGARIGWGFRQVIDRSVA